jgi:hypothetical protein
VSQYTVQITERWDYVVEADTVGDAQRQAEALRKRGLNVWHNPGDPTVYDLGVITRTGGGRPKVFTKIKA